GSLETTTREQQHQEFSIARMAGAIVQAVAIGLLGWSLLDFLFEASSMTLLKITLAGVFQLMALTAFFLSREKP
ncbi:MAG: hypothetical protein HZB38_00765, partial [Planctomycetes bacterium]|nr:hypothetical protein [Planctomycetota bacterium]